MKKIIITEDQYDEINKLVNEEESNNRFKFNVNIDIEYKGKIKEYIDDISASEITLTYLIDIEYRHWGIKNINVYSINGPSEIEINVIYYPNGLDHDTEEKSFVIPLNWDIVEKEEETGMGVIRIGNEITLHVTENENNELHCTNIIVPIFTL